MFDERARAFDLGEGEDAVLLVHGFASTPAEMRPIAERLAADGLRVRAMLLPGHGVTPEDLEVTPWPRWYEGVASAAAELGASHRRVYGVGFSTGGSLMLRLAALEPARLSALACLATPVMLTGAARLYGVLRKMGLAGRIRFWPKMMRDIRDRAARRFYPSYPKLPMRSVDSLEELLIDVRARLHDVHTPLFVAQSRRDHTVAHKNARVILAGVSSRVKEALWLDQSFHVITVDRERDKVADGVASFFARQRAPDARGISANE